MQTAAEALSKGELDSSYLVICVPGTWIVSILFYSEYPSTHS